MGSLLVNRASMRCRAKSRALAPPPPVASRKPLPATPVPAASKPTTRCELRAVKGRAVGQAKARTRLVRAFLYQRPLAGKRVVDETLRGISVVCLPADSLLRLLCSGELVSLCGSDRGVNDEQGT